MFCRFLTAKAISVFSVAAHHSFYTMHLSTAEQMSLPFPANTYCIIT